MLSIIMVYTFTAACSHIWQDEPLCVYKSNLYDFYHNAFWRFQYIKFIYYIFTRCTRVKDCTKCFAEETSSHCTFTRVIDILFCFKKKYLI